jgi:hypothetical protein
VEDDSIGKDVPGFIRHGAEGDATGPHVPSFIRRGTPDDAGKYAPQALEVTWDRALSVWWLIAWRSVAGGLVTGAALGVVVGVIGAALDTAPIGGTWVSKALSMVVALAWMLVCVRWALQKRYDGFRIALLRE